MFGLKYPSLLQFDHDARTDELVRENLRRLYGIKRAPCDTALRERLDEVDPRQLRAVFKRVFTLLQRGKGLEGFTCLDGHYVLSVDGDGLLLLLARALRAVLREAPSRRSHDVLPPDAGGGAGASGQARGVRLGAGADREGGRGEEERL